MAIFAPDDVKNDKYPYLRDYTSFLKKMERPLVGRQKEMSELLACMARPELCNAILLAEAGSGKTALVQGTMLRDSGRAYLEVDLPKMITNLKNENEMADKLKRLFEEVAQFRLEYGKEIVLFIDEFHQIVQLSSAAVEVLKPLLADSGTRGIRVIAATTYIEYQDYIAANQPLVERLQRINLSEPDKETVIQILKGMADRYQVMDQFRNDTMFEAIYEYTNRYIPANAQPRKSILMLDSMIGWHRYSKKPINIQMLADVIYDTEGINIAFRVDATTIKQRLDKAVFAQDFASRAIEKRLQICCADLNNKDKPMSSFLFTGSTGVGKGLLNSERIPVYDEAGMIREKQNGDLKVGDFVFNRLGQPVKVVGVYPRGLQDIYEVTFSDGRSIKTDGSHLWTYKCKKGSNADNTYTNSTKELFERGTIEKSKSNKNIIKYWIPMNHAVQYSTVELPVDPYVMGAFICRRCDDNEILSFSSKDKDITDHIGQLLGNCNPVLNKNLWRFKNNCPEKYGSGEWVNKKDVFLEYAELLNKSGSEKFIPKEYMTSSIEQRWELIRGLFDTKGIITKTNEHNISFSSISETLIKQVQELLYSLGIASTIHTVRRVDTKVTHCTQYRLHVKVSDDDKIKFFWLTRKRDLVKSNQRITQKDYAWVGIKSIKRLDTQEETTCIYVDDEEHLYQAGQYIVTHNTEMTKQLAKILFDNERSLIRMDMTEYALDDSLERFRDEITTKVWARPYSIVLLDEIEKACAPVTRILLQVLDDGRLLDRNNREVTFKNCYIIITTNAGSEIYKTIAQYNADDAGSGKFVEKYEALIKESIKGTTGGNRFPPELLGRIDCLVPFQPLSEQTMAKICCMKILKLRDEILEKHELHVQVGRKIIRYIVQDRMTTDSDAGGARAVISRLESDVITPIAAFINHLDRHLVKDNTIYVDIQGRMAVDYKSLVESEARVVVSYRRISNDEDDFLDKNSLN